VEGLVGLVGDFCLHTMVFAFVLQWGKPCFWVGTSLLTDRAAFGDC
jgi:hypothetical protein